MVAGFSFVQIRDERNGAIRTLVSALVFALNQKLGSIL